MIKAKELSFLLPTLFSFHKGRKTKFPLKAAIRIMHNQKIKKPANKGQNQIIIASAPLLLAVVILFEISGVNHHRLYLIKPGYFLPEFHIIIVFLCRKLSAIYFNYPCINNFSLFKMGSGGI